MKVLVISHNPFSSFQNMGKTMLSLFSAFDKNEVCQFYIYPSLPDVDKCSSYYRITDKNILSSYFKFRVKGKEVQFESTIKQSLFENANDEKLYRNRKNKKPLRSLLRDLMWKWARWFNKDLRNWLDKEKPTCIFVAPGKAKFLYDLALKISKVYNIPIVTYICDDYYFVKSPTRILEKIQLNKLKKKIEKLISNSKQVITICKELEKVYYDKFNILVMTIMTGSNYKISDHIFVRDNVELISYMGNIRCNRYNSLAEIGRVIDEINDEDGSDYKLNIYTAEKDFNILKHFKNIKSINLCGFVFGDEFKRVLYSSDLLLHVEAFDEESVDLVKHSVSTKIADSLASGVCLIAYGPENIASMHHLLKNECAFCITTKEKLKSSLKSIFFDYNLRAQYAEKALITAKEWHDAEITSKNFYTVMEKVNEGNAN